MPMRIAVSVRAAQPLIIISLVSRIALHHNILMTFKCYAFHVIQTVRNVTVLIIISVLNAQVLFIYTKINAFQIVLISIGKLLTLMEIFVKFRIVSKVIFTLLIIYFT